MEKLRVYAVITSGGTGARMNAPLPKQFLKLGNKTILSRTIEAFAGHDGIEGLILICPSGYEEMSRESLALVSKPCQIIKGGHSRQESVYLGLKAVPENVDIILIHDGVRPFVTKNEISSVIEAAGTYGGALLAVPVKETVKIAENGYSLKTPARDMLFAAQTPQGFKKEIIMKAHEEAVKSGFTGSDDASLTERIGCFPRIIDGDYRNIKITTYEDLQVAEVFLREIP